jgi:hypothetical protein
MIDAVTRQLSPRWNRKRPFVETWCTSLNHLSSGAGFWIRYSLAVPRTGPARGEVWFASSTPGRESASAAFGCRFGADEIDADGDLGMVRIGPCLLEPEGITGMLACEGTPVAWELEYRPVTDPLQSFSGPAREGAYDFVVPYPFMLAGGRIQVRDHQFSFNGDPGLQSHSWGPDSPPGWTWFHCSGFVQEGGDPIPAYVTGASFRPPLLGSIPGFPRSSGHLVFNEKHVPIRAVHSWQERMSADWHWAGQAGGETISVRVKIPWSGMIAAEYRSLSGGLRCLHNTDLATCRVTINSPGRPATILESQRMAHVQVETPRPDPRVRRVLSMV